MTLRGWDDAVLAAAVVALLRGRLAFRARVVVVRVAFVLRRAAVFFPPFRPAAERRADVAALRFFAPPRFELLLLVDRFLDDEDRLLDELRPPRPFDDFEDLPEDLLFDAAMVCLLLNIGVGNRTGIRNHAAYNVWCTRCTGTM